MYVPILLYHSISEKAAPPFKRWAVHPELFEKHLKYLREQDYTPLTVTQFVDLNRDTYLPERPVLVTFDDGFADFYTEALPLLQEYACPATLYITTAFVGHTSRWLAAQGEGDRPMLSWNQVRELPSRGVECGAHTCSHPQLDTLNLKGAREEVAGSKRALEQQLGQPVSSFAYPHGYHSSAVKKLVRQLGFTSACAVKHAMSNPADDPFALARIIVSADTNLVAFEGLLSGQVLPTTPLRERWQTKAWRLARRSARLLKNLTPKERRV